MTTGTGGGSFVRSDVLLLLDYFVDHGRVSVGLSSRSDGQSMKASTNGRTSAPNGIIMINESQGDKPAFLQINQKGSTPTSATKTATMKITTSSGIPIGPMVFVFV